MGLEATLTARHCLAVSLIGITSGIAELLSGLFAAAAVFPSCYHEEKAT
jgi:hypothetical protein